MRTFLDHLDSEYNDILNLKKINHPEYIKYFSLILQDDNITSCFECAKSKKTRILYKVNSIRVDLTDYDIIHIICSRSEEFIDMILGDLKKVYQETYNDFSFKIDEKIFNGVGIEYKKYNNDIFLLDSDVTINVHSFLFIINMILYKDFVAENYVKDKGLMKLIDKTVIKYISLILFHGKKSEEARLYLQSISFPINTSIEELVYNKKSNKRYDELFTKEKFDTLLQF